MSTETGTCQLLWEIVKELCGVRGLLKGTFLFPPRTGVALRASHRCKASKATSQKKKNICTGDEGKMKGRERALWELTMTPKAEVQEEETGTLLKSFSSTGWEVRALWV